MRGWLVSPKIHWAATLVLLALVCVVLGYERNRTLSWQETLSPIYWIERSRGDGYYAPQHALLRRGNHDLREVALTFDDGPHTESRLQILGILKHYGAKATFFEVGMRMAQRPDLLMKTIEEGHEIANHTMYHNYIANMEASARHREINDTDIVYNRLTGKHLQLLRPPGMHISNAMFEDTTRLGYITVGYTTLAGDYGKDAHPQEITKRVLKRVDNGGILLLHDYPATAQALPQILETLQQEGYTCITISEMMSHLPEKARLQIAEFQQAHTLGDPLPRPDFLKQEIFIGEKPRRIHPKKKPAVQTK
jgi:peptidoglycan/xylan/chitin deacetylase (PgdA/CDA1 family)